MASSSSTATSRVGRWGQYRDLGMAAGRWLVSGPGRTIALIGYSALMSTVPAAGAARLLGWAIPGKPLFIQLPLLVISFSLLACLIWGITAERGRRALFGDSVAYRIPFIASLFVLFFSFACFGALTCFMLERGWLEITPDVGHDEHGVSRLMDFYLWHVLDAIPLAEVTETIRWEQPYTYHDSLTGVILLAFKVGIIVPVLRTFSLGKRALTPVPPADGPDVAAAELSESSQS